MAVDYERGASEDRLDEVRHVLHCVLCPTVAGQEHGQHVTMRNRSPEYERLRKTKQKLEKLVVLF